jgi:hypothetical protein
LAKKEYIGIFDDLKENTNAFAQELFDFLEVENYALKEELRKKSLPAAKARSKWAAYLAKRAAWLFRELGFPRVVGKVKNAWLVHHLSYDPYDEKPSPDARVLDELRDYYYPTIKSLDKNLDLRLRKRWGYDRG